MNSFLKQVVDDFARMRTGLRTAKSRRTGEVRVEVDRPDVYFGWFVNEPLSRVDVDINFTAPDRQTNLARLRQVAQQSDRIREGVEFEFEAAEEGWEPSWTCAGFSIPYDGEAPPLERAPRVAQIMKVLIERTLPLLRSEVIEVEKAVVPEEVIFVVKEDESGGYSARAVGHSIFTQADTRADLEKMVRDAVRCHFEPEQAAPKLIHLHYVHDEVIAL